MIQVVNAAVAAASEANDSQGQCRVIHGPFALGVQAFLAFATVSTLLYKRYQEHPKRSWTIWFMDSAKQGFAMGLQHVVNIVLAILFASRHSKAGQCAWYITNYTITICGGLVILTLWMRLHRIVVEQHNLTWLRSGEYGNPPSVAIWAVQAVYWAFLCCAEKFITAGCVIFPLHSYIDSAIAAMEVPLLPYPKAELILVMVVGPALMNSIFAWVCDNLIKDPEVKSKDPAEAESTESKMV